MLDICQSIVESVVANIFVKEFMKTFPITNPSGSLVCPHHLLLLLLQCRANIVTTLAVLILQQACTPPRWNAGGQHVNPIWKLDKCPLAPNSIRCLSSLDTDNGILLKFHRWTFWISPVTSPGHGVFRVLCSWHTLRL